MTTGRRLFCKEFLCFNTLPYRHVPLLVHFGVGVDADVIGRGTPLICVCVTRATLMTCESCTMCTRMACDIRYTLATRAMYNMTCTI